MTRVDFYELADVDQEARARFACRLALKARDSDVRVLLFAQDEAMAKDLDDLMWQYPRDRFLPHSLGGEPDIKAKVHIDFADAEKSGGDKHLLINLSDAAPEGWQSFARVAEIVVAASRASSREKYRYYRTQVTELHHHRLETWED